MHEEQQKIASLLQSKDMQKSTSNQNLGSKVKLPYEMLISKLVDGLETPKIIE